MEKSDQLDREETRRKVILRSIELKVFQVQQVERKKSVFGREIGKRRAECEG